MVFHFCHRPSPVVLHPSRVARRASPVARRPSCVVRHPSPVSRRPSPVARRPSCVVRRPSSVSRRPSSVARRPSSVVRRPSYLVRRTSPVVCRPSCVAWRVSSVARRPCVVRRPSRVVRRVSPVARRVSSVVRRRASPGVCRPSRVARASSVAHRASSVVCRPSCVVRRASPVARRPSCVVRRASCVARSKYVTAQYCSHSPGMQACVCRCMQRFNLWCPTGKKMDEIIVELGLHEVLSRPQVDLAMTQNESATDFSGWCCAWVKTVRNISVADCLRPEYNYDDVKTIGISRRQKKSTVARIEKKFVRRVPDRRESIAVDLCVVATHARLEVAASQSACGKVSNKMEAVEWTDAEEDRLILLWQEKACLFNTGLKEFSNRNAKRQGRARRGAESKKYSLSRNLPSKCAPTYWKSHVIALVCTSRNRHRWSDRDVTWAWLCRGDACSTTFTRFVSCSDLSVHFLLDPNDSVAVQAKRRSTWGRLYKPF